MNNEIYIPDDLWTIIKSFYFHKIKYGKHLKNDKYIKKYNNILLDIPKPKVPRNGPRILYKNSFYKFYYYIKISCFKWKPIIETQKLPNDYKEFFYKYDKEIRIRYYLTYL